jgi:hypothetical protein
MTYWTRHRFTLVLLCTLMGLSVMDCGKRNRVPVADGTARLDGATLPPVKLDTSTRRDTGIVLPDFFFPPPPDQGPPSPPNSGAICFQGTGCAHNGEACMLMESGANKGMCLGKCNTAQADCPVADQATQLSKCILQDHNKQLFCAWFCEVQGKQYKCPNSTDYKCSALSPTQPDIKYCVPK